MALLEPGSPPPRTPCLGSCFTSLSGVREAHLCNVTLLSTELQNYTAPDAEFLTVVSHTPQMRPRLVAWGRLGGGPPTSDQPEPGRFPEKLVQRRDLSAKQSCAACSGPGSHRTHDKRRRQSKDRLGKTNREQNVTKLSAPAPRPKALLQASAQRPQPGK